MSIRCSFSSLHCSSNRILLNLTHKSIIRSQIKLCSTSSETKANSRAPPIKLWEHPSIQISGKDYPTDHMTNITPKILDKIGRNIHMKHGHPLDILRRRIVRYFYSRYRSYRGNPLFSVHELLHPIVTMEQNFDSLLVPKDHVARAKSDSYYVNKDHMLRAHTSAHQCELIKSGLDNFLVIGDVYRRDEIDRSHYPVFHQVEGVRLLTQDSLDKLWEKATQSKGESCKMFDENSPKRTEMAQERHSVDAVKILEHELKSCLVDLSKDLFGKDIEYRWVDAYFPFTHPSWELEIKFAGDWMEVCGCGIVEQKLLERSGSSDKIGWAFGFGLERLAMKMYEIPDIRLFWTQDSGFWHQFSEASNDIDKPVTYKAISKYPQCVNDISFWLPPKGEGENTEEYSSNDFYDLVREIGGDLIEQVSLFDDFVHKKKGLRSHAYRITYRSNERTLTQEEVNEIHKQIEETAKSQLNVVIR